MLTGMKLGSLFILAGCLVAFGCGGDDTSNGTGSGASGQGGSGQGGGAQGGAGQGGGAQGGAGQGGMGQGGAGQGGGEPSDLQISIVQHTFFIDCMPVVPADPFNGTVAVDYSNGAGSSSVTADVVNTTLKLTKGNQTLDWTFDVFPASTTAGPGEKVTISHMKQADSGTAIGADSPCSFCEVGSQWTLEMSWDVGGQRYSDSIGPALVVCTR